jgi:RHS repeat-associated protein
VIDIERTSSSGAIEIRVGNAPVTVSSTGIHTFTITASGADSFKLTFDADWTGIVRSVSVKGVAVISYNHLNLPSLVSFPSDKQLRYIYDATGRKLSQHVETSAGMVLKKTDYAGEFFYENDTLKFINHEEGRVVMTGTEPEYQYHLKDHLGNVRLTFTTKDKVETFTATSETATQPAEENVFNNYNPIDRDLFDHTDSLTAYTYAQLLHGGHNSQIALAKSISVMPGDTIKAEVYAKYQELVNPGEGLDGFAAALTSAFGFSAPVPGDPATVYNALDLYGTLIEEGLDHSEDETAPKAYINILLFDREHNFVDAAYKQIGIDDKQGEDLTVKDRHGYLNFEKLVTTPGYAYIFLSNENPTQVDVYFDDLKIEHVKSPVVQMDDYYPFGLTFNSYRREDSTPNLSLYNSKEMQDELNLGWMDYGARMYMPDIGRWNSKDLLAEKFVGLSPYVFALNNPVRFTDLDGMDPEDNTITDDALKKLNVKTGYGIEVSRKDGSATITKTTHSIQKANSKSSSFAVTQTIFNINANGEVEKVSQSITSYDASVDAEGNVQVSDGVDQTNNQDYMGAHLDYSANNKGDAEKFVSEEPLVKSFADVIAKNKEAAISGDLPYRDRNWADNLTTVVNFVGSLIENELTPPGITSDNVIIPEYNNPGVSTNYHVELNAEKKATERFNYYSRNPQKIIKN